MIILHSNETLEGKELSGFDEDAVRVMGDNVTVKDNLIFDTKEDNLPHRDGIQLIPTGREPNAQYFGAELKHPYITSNTITSPGSLQGIFSSDGVITGAEITDNIIDTRSPHKVTINGLLSGVISGNKDISGKPVRVYLDSLRIGGGHKHAFYVLSFKDHRYENITHYSDTHLIDRRGKAWNHLYKYVQNFDLNLFRKISESIEYQPDGFEAHFLSVILIYQHETGQKLAG